MALIHMHMNHQNKPNSALQVTRCRVAPIVAMRQRSPEFSRYVNK